MAENVVVDHLNKIAPLASKMPSPISELIGDAVGKAFDAAALLVDVPPSNARDLAHQIRQQGDHALPAGNEITDHCDAIERALEGRSDGASTEVLRQVCNIREAIGGNYEDPVEEA